MHEGETLTVQSVPAAHPYVVGALPDPALDPVRMLPDPVVDPADPDRWWPPRALDAAWLEAHGRSIDVLHVHFGFDTAEPADLAAAASAARGNGTALVVTVHDLHNPHQAEPGPHLDRLEVLVRAADVLFTLTPSAADEVERRWGRRPWVLPHPHLAAGASRPPASRRERRASPRVGVHLKDLRANIDAAVALDGLERVGAATDATLEVRVHRDVLHRDHPRHDPALPGRLDALSARPGVEVLRHDRLDDAALADALLALDVAVLPYRFGTHSGWLQLCRDLGVRVAVPDCGHYRAQVEPSAVAVYATGDPDSLAGAVGRLLDAPAPAPSTAAERERRRSALRAAHLDAYRSAVRDVVRDVGPGIARGVPRDTAPGRCS